MAETRKNACPDCGGALDHWRGSVACEEYKVRTDQTAQGGVGWVWECWTCGDTMRLWGGETRTTALPVGGTKETACHAAGHDVRRVEGKA